MQRQHQSEHEQEAIKPKQRRGRRSWGELLMAWLVLLWGITSSGWNIVIFTLLLRMGRDDLSVPVLASYIFTLMQSLACFAGGVFALLRYRSLACWMLVGSAFCFVGMVGLSFVGTLPALLNSLILGAIYLIPATFLVFLGRWLGRQEDIME